MKSGFRITKGKGFTIKFDNEYTVSVQFGRYNYCNNYILNHADEIGRKDWEVDKNGDVQCSNAEVAVFDPDGEFMQLFGEEGREVAGYYTPEEVLELLSEVVSFRTVSASDEQAK